MYGVRSAVCIALLGLGRPVVGVIATKLPVAPSFHREVIVVFSMRPASLLRVCVRPAERLAAW